MLSEDLLREAEFVRQLSIQIDLPQLPKTVVFLSGQLQELSARLNSLSRAAGDLEDEADE